MEDLNRLKRVCGFYVSSVHLVTMILPFIKQEIENKVKIETFLEYNFNEIVDGVLTNVITKSSDKSNILDINWKNNKIQKYSNIEKRLRNLLEKNKEVNLLISGSKKYINETNKILNKFFDKYYNKINNKYIKIINCYEVMEFDDNIREILDNHEYIINTSGIHKIEEVFEDYTKKKIVN